MMPANLTPQYKEAEARFRAATTNEDRLACLEEMLRLMPKHKGTEKLQADLKRRIAKLGRQETKKTVKRVPGEFVEREGIRQVLLVGAPNAGKSSLLKSLTSANPDVAPYPFTTTKFQPGMMRYEDVQVELVDGPATCSTLARPWMSNQLRACDLVLWVVSLADDDLLAGVDDLQSTLSGWHVRLRPAVAGTLFHPVEGEGEGGLVFRSTLLVATHTDADDADVRAEILRDSLDPAWVMHRVSTTTGAGIEALRRLVFDHLDVVRVYTKLPGKKPDHENPFLLDLGSTVLDLAEEIHKDIAGGLKFARIWGAGSFDGQHVQRDHVLADGDVVELHA
jgi:ribosome-interacting GTPase 1